MSVMLTTSKIGRYFKSSHLKKEIKQVDENFKRSFLVGTLFIGLTCLGAALSGYVLMGLVTVMLGVVFGLGSLLGKFYFKRPLQKTEKKPEDLPSLIYSPPKIPVARSHAELQALGEQIFSKPSRKRPK